MQRIQIPAALEYTCATRLALSALASSFIRWACNGARRSGSSGRLSSGRRATLAASRPCQRGELEISTRAARMEPVPASWSWVHGRYRGLASVPAFVACSDEVSQPFTGWLQSELPAAFRRNAHPRLGTGRLRSKIAGDAAQVPLASARDSFGSMAAQRQHKCTRLAGDPRSPRNAEHIEESRGLASFSAFRIACKQA
jgi:hypothetical protein